MEDSRSQDPTADRERDEQGRLIPTRTDAEVLAAVDECEPAATSEVADELEISRQAADYRLRKLADVGRVQKKKIAASLVWFLADDEMDTISEETR